MRFVKQKKPKLLDWGCETVSNSLVTRVWQNLFCPVGNWFVMHFINLNVRQLLRVRVLADIGQ